MIETAASIIVNVVSDFVFVAIVIVAGWVVFATTRRTRLLSFYGLDASRRIVVYLSNLRVMSGGAIGIDSRRRSYQGSAGAFGEMHVATEFRDLFNYLVPSLSERPGLLSKLLISDVQVQLRPSPLSQGQIEPSCPFVTLGSPAYNAASGYVESQLNSKARFVADGSAILVEDMEPLTDTTLGFVERIVDPERSKRVFYAAGLSELGTIGAAHFLATQWARLHRSYSDDTPFLVMLRFEPTNFRLWSVVFER